MQLFFNLFLDEPVERIDKVMVLMSLEMGDHSFNIIFDLFMEVYDTVSMCQMMASRSPFNFDISMKFFNIVDSLDEFIFTDGAIIDDSNLKHVQPVIDWCHEEAVVRVMLMLE